MKGQVVLITGALAGIGRATALAFAREGASVVISGRRDEEGRKLEAELRGLGVEAEYVRADVRHEEDVRNLIDRTVARFGRLDVAVNNAGTEGQPGPVTEQTAESYAATFDTNVLGVLLSMKHELRVMLAAASRQHRQCVVRRRPGRLRRRVGLRGQQARGRRAHEVGGARGGGGGRARQYRRPRSDRDRDAEPVHRHGGEEGRPGRPESRSSASATPRRSRRPSCSSRPTRRRSSRVRPSRVDGGMMAQ